MKKICILTLLMGFVASQALASDPGTIGNYNCYGKGITVYSAKRVKNPAGKKEVSYHDNYEMHPRLNDGITIDDLKKLSPKNDCHYGTVDAGPDTGNMRLEKANCFIAFVDKSAITVDKYYSKSPTEIQCSFHKDPDKVAGITTMLNYEERQNLVEEEFQGKIDNDIKKGLGSAVCIARDETINDYLFCEVLGPVKDANGKRIRLATVNFDMTSSKGAASGVTGGNTPSVPSAEEGKKEGGKKLIKKLGF